MRIQRNRRLLAAFAAALAPCALGAQQAVPAPAEVRVSARLLAMADARYLDTLLVDSVVRDGAPWLRLQAVRAAGQVNGRVRAPLLRSLLADPDTAVAATAAFSLGLMRDTGAIPALDAALRAAPPVHQEAAASLGRLGEPARDVLLRELGRAPSAAVILALSPLRPVPSAAIVPFLRNDDAEIRWAATYVLTRNVVPEAAGPLLAALDLAPAVQAGHSPRTEPSDVRAGIARGLSRNAVPDTLRSQARLALGRLLSDEHPHVRIAAVRALASYATASRGLLEATIANDPDANVRVAAVQAATQVFGPDSLVWEAVWASDTSTMTRVALLQGASQHGILLAAADTTRPDSWVFAADPRKRAVVAAVVIPMGDTASMERAVRFRRDGAAVVVRAAVAALSASARGEAVARDSSIATWFGFAAHSLDDVWARATAATAFGRIARGDMAGELVKAYERALGDELPAARHAVLQALVTTWRRDSAGFGAWADTLRRWPPARDARSLSIARDLPPLAAWRDAPYPGRSAAEWEALVRTLVLPSLAGTPPRATFVTTRGTIEVELLGAEAPLTADNLRSLAGHGYFDGIEWHRVVPYFVAQAGDPSGTGSGGPGYSIRDELNRHRYDRGVLGMALSGPDTGGSQWFFTHAAQPHLDAGYTVFGRIVEGLDVMDSLVQWDRLLSVRVR